MLKICLGVLPLDPPTAILRIARLSSGPNPGVVRGAHFEFSVLLFGVLSLWPGNL